MSDSFKIPLLKYRKEVKWYGRDGEKGMEEMVKKVWKR